MTALAELLNQPWAQRAGWTLLHFLWQGAIIAALLWVALRLLSRRRPQVRYAVACGALLLMIAAPAATFFLVPQPPPHQADTAQVSLPGECYVMGDVAHPGVYRPGETISDALARSGATSPAGGEWKATLICRTPDEKEQVWNLDLRETEQGREFSDRLQPNDELVVGQQAPGPALLSGLPRLKPTPAPQLPASEKADGELSLASRALAPALPYTVCLWLAGVIVCSIWHLGGWLRIQRMRHSGELLGEEGTACIWGTAARGLAGEFGIRSHVALLKVADLLGPVAFGVLKPAVLIPATIVTALTPAHIEAILAHELAHIRRRDYVVNLLQTLVETVLFYHPAVWWVSSRIRAEREHCCDDMAIAAIGDGHTYAAALAALAEIVAAHQPADQRRGALGRLAPALHRAARTVGRIAPGAGMYAGVPPYSVSDWPGDAWIYKWAKQADAQARKQGHLGRELVGRLDGTYTKKGTLHVAEQYIEGKTIRINLRYVDEDRDIAGPGSPMIRAYGDKKDKSVYVWGELPADLAPGKYAVVLELTEYLRKDDKLIVAPKTDTRRFEHLECTYTVASPATTQTQPAPGPASQPTTGRAGNEPSVDFLALRVEGKFPHEWPAWRGDGQPLAPKSWQEASYRVNGWIDAPKETGEKLVLLIHCPSGDAEKVKGFDLLDQAGTPVASTFKTWNADESKEWLNCGIIVAAKDMPARAVIRLKYDTAGMNQVHLDPVNLAPVIKALSAQTATAPATAPAERFFYTSEGPGDELCNAKAKIEVTAEAAEKMFQAGGSHLAGGWEKLLPKDIKPEPDAGELPDLAKIHGIPPASTAPYAHVAEFSDKHLVIRISKPGGAYLWHHYEDNIATFVTGRTKALDAAFDLPKLEKEFTVEYRGLRQGDAFKKIVQVLGKPEKTVSTQAEEFTFYYYAGGSIRFDVWQGKVWRIITNVKDYEGPAGTPGT